MHVDTVNIAVVREPMSRLRSSFNFFKVPKMLKLENVSDPISTFLENPKKYINERSSRLIEITQNWFATEFGFNSHKHTIKEYLAYIESRFTVLIMERLPESMIVLKRKLCWNMKDVMYFHAKNKNYSRDITPNETLVQLHKNYSPLEYAFYEHFHKVMAHTIDSLGQDLQQEVAIFSTYLDRTRNFCSRLCSKMGKLVKEKADRTAKKLVLNEYEYFAANKWNPSFNVTGVDCLLMMFSAFEYLPANTVRNFPENCLSAKDQPIPLDRNYCQDYFAYEFPWKVLEDPMFANKCY